MLINKSMEKTYYTIYKITNQIDGKIYIGSHKTKNLNDNYMGSGKYLKYAQDKYGIENFTKDVLFVFDTSSEMYAKEAEIVTEEFIATENTYNLKVGGFGGWDYINEHGINVQWRDPEERNRRISETTQRKWESDPTYGLSLRRNAGNRSSAFIQSARVSFLGKTHTEDTKRRIGAANSRLQQGNNNSQFGTMWISNGTECKKIHNSDAIPSGWRRGRK